MIVENQQACKSLLTSRCVWPKSAWQQYKHFGHVFIESAWCMETYFMSIEGDRAHDVS